MIYSLALQFWIKERRHRWMEHTLFLMHLYANHITVVQILYRIYNIFQGVTEILLNFLKLDQQVKLQVECIHTFYFCLGPFSFAKISPNFLYENSLHLLVSFLVIPIKSIMQSMGPIWNGFLSKFMSLTKATYLSTQ